MGDSEENPADATMVYILQQSCLYSTQMELHPFTMYHQEVEISALSQDERREHLLLNQEHMKRTYSVMVDDVGALSLVRDHEERYGSDFITLGIRPSQWHLSRFLDSLLLCEHRKKV